MRLQNVGMVILLAKTSDLFLYFHYSRRSLLAKSPKSVLLPEDSEMNSLTYFPCFAAGGKSRFSALAEDREAGSSAK